MNRTVQFCWRSLRACLATVGSFALWSVWLALAIVLVVQISIAVTSELAVPDFLLKAIETRLGESGIRATFGRTSFDPHGRVLIEDVKLSLPTLSEPILTARAVYLNIDLWNLSVGRFVPTEVRVTGANLVAPAVLSASGKTEELIRNLDFIATPHGHEINIDRASFYLGNISVLVHGAIDPTALKSTSKTSLPLADLLGRNFPAIAKRATLVIDRLASLQQPVVRLELTPSPTLGAVAELNVQARSLTLEQPVAVQANNISVRTRTPLGGEAPITATVDVSTSELHLLAGIEVRGAMLQLRGRLDAAKFTFEPTRVELTATSATGRGFTADAPRVYLTPGPLPKLSVEALARIAGERIAAQAEVQIEQKTASVHVAGTASPALIDPINAVAKIDLRRFIDLGAPIVLDASAQFSAGWHFENVQAHVSTEKLLGAKVTFDEVRGDIAFDGTHFVAPAAYARIGQNFAHGSVVQDLKTRDYRFLLEGQLRPYDISPWFHDWWSTFFREFEFPASPPAANVDVRGRWGAGRESNVFVYAESGAAVVRGAAWDSVRTRLFIRPNFTQGLELLVTKGQGEARGTFERIADLDASSWRSVDFDFATSVDPIEGVKFFHGMADRLIAPYKFTQPPTLKLKGHLDGPSAPDGQHTIVSVEGRTDAPMRYYDFPGERASVTVNVHDNDIAVEPLKFGLAGGEVSGSVHVNGGGDDRRLKFEGALKGGNLAKVIATIDDFNATRHATAPKPPSRFLKEHSDVRIDVNAKAVGKLDDAFSYQGDGHAEIKGPELAEVRLLGVFSEVLPFTSLRFTAAKGDFKIAGPKLEFPEIKVTGANSAMDARGSYALDRRELDFNVKVYPLQESNNPLKAVASVVLAPLSSIFEVHLTGPIDKPVPRLGLAPTNLLRGLAPNEAAATPPAPNAQPTKESPPPTADSAEPKPKE